MLQLGRERRGKETGFHDVSGLPLKPGLPPVWASKSCSYLCRFEWNFLFLDTSRALPEAWPTISCLATDEVRSFCAIPPRRQCPMVLLLAVLSLFWLPLQTVSSRRAESRLLCSPCPSSLQPAQCLAPSRCSVILVEWGANGPRAQ